MRAKDKVISLVRTAEWEGLEEEARKDTRVLNGLIQALNLADEEMAWRAAEGFGRAAAIVSGTDGELCRDRMARLVGTFNDEQCGVSARFTAPALGEAIARVPETFIEHAPMLLFALAHPCLQAGAAWAVGRIGGVRPDLVMAAAPRIIPLLRGSDPAVRGNAAWALGEMRSEEAVAELEVLKNDSAPLRIYSEGRLTETTVGELAAAAKRKITSSR
ncbi:MAG: DVU0298 family protein [Bacillota bacterium]